jgi:hypothetical protein
MSRALLLASVVGLLLLAGAVLADLVAPSTSVAVPLVILAAIVFLGVVLAIFASAWRTKGWSLRHPGGQPR